MPESSGPSRQSVTNYIVSGAFLEIAFIECGDDREVHVPQSDVAKASAIYSLASNCNLGGNVSSLSAESAERPPESWGFHFALLRGNMCESQQPVHDRSCLRCIKCRWSHSSCISRLPIREPHLPPRTHCHWIIGVVCLPCRRLLAVWPACQCRDGM